jgi:hypothetical protein
MRALMVEMPPSISGLLEHAVAVHGIGSWSHAGPRSRCTALCYAQAAVRARCLAKVLRRLGSGDPDKVHGMLAENAVSRANGTRAQTLPLLRALIFAPGGQR